MVRRWLVLTMSVGLSWCRHFDDVQQEVSTLHHTRYMWRTLLKLWEHSVPLDQQYTVVHNYFVRTYVSTVSTAIRREADKDARTTALARRNNAL
jgi:hypothetical protein